MCNCHMMSSYIISIILVTLVVSISGLTYNDSFWKQVKYNWTDAQKMCSTLNKLLLPDVRNDANTSQILTNLPSNSLVWINAKYINSNNYTVRIAFKNKHLTLSPTICEVNISTKQKMGDDAKTWNQTYGHCTLNNSTKMPNARDFEEIKIVLPLLKYNKPVWIDHFTNFTIPHYESTDNMTVACIGMMKFENGSYDYATLNCSQPQTTICVTERQNYAPTLTMLEDSEITFRDPSLREPKDGRETKDQNSQSLLTTIIGGSICGVFVVLIVITVLYVGRQYHRHEIYIQNSLRYKDSIYARNRERSPDIISDVDATKTNTDSKAVASAALSPDNKGDVCAATSNSDSAAAASVAVDPPDMQPSEHLSGQAETRQYICKSVQTAMPSTNTADFDDNCYEELQRDVIKESRRLLENHYAKRSISGYMSAVISADNQSPAAAVVSVSQCSANLSEDQSAESVSNFSRAHSKNSYNGSYIVMNTPVKFYTTNETDAAHVKQNSISIKEPTPADLLVSQMEFDEHIVGRKELALAGLASQMDSDEPTPLISLWNGSVADNDKNGSVKVTVKSETPEQNESEGKNENSVKDDKLQHSNSTTCTWNLEEYENFKLTPYKRQYSKAFTAKTPTMTTKMLNECQKEEIPNAQH